MVELIVVIVILGVLAAVALPKFVDMSSNARAARIDAMAAELHTVAASVKAQCMLKPNCIRTPTGFINLWNKSVHINFGFPDAGNTLNTGQIDTLVETTGFIVSLLNHRDTKFSLSSAPDPANCAVVYRDAYSSTREIAITPLKTGC